MPIHVVRFPRIAVASALLLLSFSLPAHAFEALDGRLQAHGYFEMQLRALSSDFSEQWDLAQWYNVLNVELELAIAPDGVGPFDMVNAFIRVEGRFDCVYYSGCGMISAADTYGNDARRLPERLNNARIVTSAGTVVIEEDTKDYRLFELRSRGGRDPVNLARVAGYSTLAAQRGADGLFGDPVSSDSECATLYGALCDQLAGGSAALYPTNDDPFPYVFENFDSFRFAQINRPGGFDVGLPTLVFGPWRPDDRVDTIATLADRINPLDRSRGSRIVQAAVYNDTLLSTGDPAMALAAAQLATGGGALPYRPIPIEGEGRNGVADTTARGLYLPSTALRREIESGRLDSFPFNFSQVERAFNRGSSQQDEGELKEAYLDIEMFDSRLWLRIGKQQIVWGKTELFRTTDQFNPVDLALSSLPSLEESRIGLWALRGVWSFYEKGPFQDVRLELAANIDDFEPNDLGACGEAYTPNPACQLTFGGFAHGTFGVGLVGFDRPPSPWKSLSGWEVGGRLEFRWDRFSFQLSDFWGFEDVPYADQIGFYERNVDPATGRPRVYGSRGSCADPATDPACLQPGPTGQDPLFDLGLLDDSANALDSHHANEQIFTAICASSVGFSRLDTAACGQTVFNSQRVVIAVEIGSLLGGLLYGGPTADNLQLFATGGVPLPLVTLSVGDGRETDNPGGCIDPNTGAPCGGLGTSALPTAGESLSSALTPEQEALIGCGPYWGTNCDDSGIDLLNAEASALLQSFTGFPGTAANWNTGTANPQPGTAGFGAINPSTGLYTGGSVCTVGNLGGSIDPRVRLPGCRGPSDPGYSLTVDGSPATVRTLRTPPPSAVLSNPQVAGTPGVHPFTGQAWSSEMAALSWNFQMIAVSQSSNFEPANAYVEGVCSFVTPQFCASVQSAFDITGIQRKVVAAGGNGAFGRVTYRWHSGGEAVARYTKRNVLGFSLDFAEDRTKSNVSVESTWIHNIRVANNDRASGVSKIDQLNMTVSVDRPTFVNFINSNRTLLINTQWFFQYLVGYEDGMPQNGPWNVLATLNVSTGYAQDRLIPQFTFVHDFQSQSGAFLPQITYRMTSNFSATVGMGLFYGRTQLVDMPLRSTAPASTRAGSNAYRNPVENGLSAIRERDEIFARIRYTF